jgi:hypothetical protein
MIVCYNLLYAATHLRHSATVAVHSTAAGALFWSHHVVGDARQQGRGGEEKQEQSDEGGEAAHQKTV